MDGMGSDVADLVTTVVQNSTKYSIFTTEWNAYLLLNDVYTYECI